MSNRTFKSLSASVLALAFFASASASAQQFTWQLPGAGPHQWNVNNNWSPNTGFPTGVDVEAVLGINITTNQTINLNTSIILGKLTIGDSSGNNGTQTIANGTGGPHSLTFQVSSGSAELVKQSTNINSINVATVLNSNLDLNVTGGTLEMNGLISGLAGMGITKTGVGILQLSQNNTYSGSTSVTGGTLRLGSGGTTGNIGGAANADALTDADPLTISGNTTLAINRSNTFTLSKNLGDTVILLKEGSGTLIVNGATNTPNRVEITGGTLSLQASGTLGAGDIRIHDGSLEINRASDTTLSNRVVGRGTLIAAGGNVTTLTANNNAYSKTTINAGSTLQVGDGGANGSLGRGQVTNDGTLIFNRSGTITATPRITGTGQVIHRGTGATHFTTPGSWSGGLLIESGNVVSTDHGHLGTGAITVNHGGTLTLGTDPNKVKNISGFTPADWTLNGNGLPNRPRFEGGNLVLTDNVTFTRSSAIYEHRLPVSEFNLSFDYTPTLDGSPADGFTLVFHNDSRGVNALGQQGGVLGYAGGPGGFDADLTSGIATSVAVAFDIAGGANNNNRGVNDISTDGFLGLNGTSGGLEINFTLPYNVEVSYDGTDMVITVKGTGYDSLPAEFIKTYANVDLPDHLGNYAYIGFTAGTGGSNVGQTISNFSFNSTTTPDNGNTYQNDLFVADGATGNLAILPNAIHREIVLQDLTLGGGGAILAVSAAPGSINGRYGVSFKDVTLNDQGSTFTLANNGTDGGDLRFHGEVKNTGTAGVTTFTLNNGILHLESGSTISFSLLDPTGTVDSFLDPAAMATAISGHADVGKEPGSGDHDHFAITGSLFVQAGATFKLNPLTGFNPQAGDFYNLLNFDSTQATFASGYLFDLPDLSFGLGWNTSLFESHGILFVVVPEPSRFLLLGLGFMGLLLRRRRARPHALLPQRGFRSNDAVL